MPGWHWTTKLILVICCRYPPFLQVVYHLFFVTYPIEPLLPKLGVTNIHSCQFYHYFKMISVQKIHRLCRERYNSIWKDKTFLGGGTTTLQLFASGFDPLYQQWCGGVIRKATLIIQENDAATTCTLMASINGWLWLCDDDDTVTHKATNFGYTHILTCCLL